MKRRIIKIDEDKCNGCGLCASACHEGAIEVVDGKAKLVREHFCDGLGDCLPSCPMGAIHFEEREAPAYDEAAVKAAQKAKAAVPAGQNGPAGQAARRAAPAGGCPGSALRQIRSDHGAGDAAPAAAPAVSRLGQWPCQIKLVPSSAPFFDGARLLIAADCTAYAYANFHEAFMRGKVTLIGCPKLDGVDYTEKLAEIIQNNDIRSVTILRMEVPCCGGLQRAAEAALKASGKFIPWQVVTISVDGTILE